MTEAKIQHLSKDRSIMDAATGAAFLLMGLMPVMLPFVRRAGPVLLVMAAALSLFSLWRNGRLAAGIQAELRSASVVVGLIFLGWAAITIIWTPWPSRAAMAVASGALMFACAIALWANPDARSDRFRFPVLAIAVLVGAATIASDLATGDHLVKLVFGKPEPYRYNMVFVTLVTMTAAPLSHQLRRGGLLAGLALAALAFAIASGESETAKVALFAAALTYVLCLFLPRWLVGGALTAAALFAWVGFPLIAPLAKGLASFFPHLSAEGHAAERLQIWDAFARMALGGFPWGWGVESVAIAKDTAFFASQPASVQAGLNWMHPHNNAIQVAVEMGAPGLVAGLLASLSAVRWVVRDRALMAQRASFFAAVLVIGLISHGFWQAWWWSAVVAGAWMLRDVAPRKPHMDAVTP